MKSSNKYWKGFEELEQTSEFVESKSNEFYEGLPLDKVFSDDSSHRANRRDFLKYFGFSVSAVALAACNKTPVKYAMPYVVQPENVTPGMPLYYASSAVSNYEGFPVLVKVREGRPIKFEPNKEAKFFGGGLDGLAHASILSLYDTNRLKAPHKKEGSALNEMSWADADKEIVKGLKAVSAAGKKISIVTRSNTSVVLNKAIADFKAAYPSTSVVSYEAVSYSGILRANEKSYGKKVIPAYYFDKAEVIVSFAADFLGTWISPVKFSSDYGQNRVPKNGKMSKHIHFESLMSLTGANADVRVPMRASNMGSHLITLYNELAAKAGVSSISGKKMELAGDAIKHAANDLWAAKGKALVVSGSNDENDQSIVNAINGLLGSNGTTIDLANPYLGNSADEANFNAFVREANAGSIGAAIFVDCNPSYSEGKAFNDAMAKVGLKINNSLILDETCALSDYAVPNTHALESWDIKQPYAGRYVFNQPTISPVFNGRQTAESLAVWAGLSTEVEGDKTFSYEYTKAAFEASIGGDFNKAIEQGYLDKSGATVAVSDSTDASASAAVISERKPAKADLILYEKVGVRDGSFSNNPWAHEMPDPVSKVCWDNYITISKPDADEMGLKDGQTVSVSMNAYSLSNFPLLIQPGQAKGSFGIALGFGREYSDDVQNDMKDLGKNAYPFIAAGDTKSYVQSGDLKIEADGVYELARTQSHHTIEGRDVIREASLDEYIKDPLVTNHHKHNLVSLWAENDFSTGHHWAMAIDLNSCTGCSSCIVSCSIENNVPIVGRDEVRRRREMHWLRIDRYYSFEVPESAHIDMGGVDGETDLETGEYITREKEIDAYAEDVSNDLYSNVKVIHQPMMCQHCDHAPCETVCPVLATTHSSEGLNQMTYNRCIGTKYCANNCPYKVRRFNWFRFNDNKKFDYHFNNDLGKMVINPDVTVRSRGVMEKCSLCVQRIQSSKLNAKRENRKLNADEFTTACAQTCPSNAIVFGDLNDANSEISKLYKNERSYHAIEELDTKPSVMYMTKIRNKKETKTTNH